MSADRALAADLARLDRAVTRAGMVAARLRGPHATLADMSSAIQQAVILAAGIETALQEIAAPERMVRIVAQAERIAA